jgi:hypothetical protein
MLTKGHRDRFVKNVFKKFACPPLMVKYGTGSDRTIGRERGAERATGYW